MQTRIDYKDVQSANQALWSLGKYVDEGQLTDANHRRI